MLSSLKTPPVANPPAVPDPESRHKTTGPSPVSAPKFQWYFSSTGILRNGSQGTTKNSLPSFCLTKTLCGCLMIWRVNWTGMSWFIYFFLHTY